MRIVRVIGIVAILFFIGISFSCGGGGGGGAPTSSIPGTVTLDGVGLSGVTITLVNLYDCAGLFVDCKSHIEATTTTDSNGNYQFDAGYSFYTITPSKDGFTFNPSSWRIAVGSQGIFEYPPAQGPIGVATVNFTASRI
jgi:hypothetical protein